MVFFRYYSKNEVRIYRKRVYEYGATYTGKASVCDIFIKYKDGEEEDVRMAIVKQVIEREEKEIKIRKNYPALCRQLMKTE
mgnify:CR=1 FL=1